MIRDTHRERIYAAELATKPLCYRSDFTVEQVSRWLERFRASSWARKRWSAKVLRAIPVKVNRRLHAFGGQADATGIELAADALDNPYLVLHELAHVLADRMNPKGAGHGVSWLRVVRALIGRYVGKQALRLFDAELSRRGVPH